MAGQPEVQPRKRGRPTAQERRARESEILSNVLRVFLLCGYGASTVDELAAAAQVTKRTLYTYYGDKAGLFAAMVTDLAATVSLDATRDDDTLEVLAARIVSRVHSDELVGLHRLVIAESARFPELAVILHSSGDARHIARLAEHIRAECGPASESLAEPLFSLLLGEKHRRRLLGIDPAPTPAEAAGHARAALAQLGLRLAASPFTLGHSERAPAHENSAISPPADAANGTLAPPRSRAASNQRSHAQAASSAPDRITESAPEPVFTDDPADNQQAHASHEIAHKCAENEKHILVILKKRHSYNKTTTTDAHRHPPRPGTRLICSLPDLSAVDIFPYSPNGRTSRELGGEDAQLSMLAQMHDFVFN